MSVKLMTAAFNSSLVPTHRLVFLALCDNASDEGVCYPSIVTICKKTGLSDRSVQRSIKYLVDNGYMSLNMRNGRSTIYQISDTSKWPDSRHSVTPDTVSPPTQCHHTPDTVSPHPRHSVTHNHQITIKGPSNNKFDAKSYLQELSVDEQTIDDWLSMRKSIKAYVSKSAIDRLKSEAFKASMELQEVLEICCANGWRGFRADWVVKQESNNSTSCAWWIDERSVIAKGNELGVKALPGESMTEFKNRIQIAIARVK